MTPAASFWLLDGGSALADDALLTQELWKCIKQSNAADKLTATSRLLDIADTSACLDAVAVLNTVPADTPGFDLVWAKILHCTRTGSDTSSTLVTLVRTTRNLRFNSACVIAELAAICDMDGGADFVEEARAALDLLGSEKCQRIVKRLDNERLTYWYTEEGRADL